MEFPFEPADAIPPLLAAGLDGLGIRLARFFIDVWDSPAGARAQALVRSVVASPEAAALMRDFVRREVLARVAEALELQDPEVRASLAASQLVGLAILRYVVKVEPLASAPPAQIAAWIGPTLQRYFTDPDATTSAPARSRRGGVKRPRGTRPG